MKRIIYLPLIILLLLSGCGPERDLNQCIYDADKTILIAGSGLEKNFISRLGDGVKSIEENLTLLCMNGKGWRWDPMTKLPHGLRPLTTDAESYKFRPWSP